MTQMFRSLRSAPLRLLGGATAAVLAGSLVLASPASAADPAGYAEAYAATTFEAGGTCTIVSGGDTSDSGTATVTSSGTKSVHATGSGTAIAQNSGDSSDTVTMKATNKVTGSVTGASGAFSKASMSMQQSGSITLSHGLSSGCEPDSVIQGGFQLDMTVKKTGKLTLRFDVPRHTIVQTALAKDGDFQFQSYSIYARTQRTITRTVKPGHYTLQVVAVAELGWSGSALVLQQNGTVGFSAAYAKS